MNDTEKEYIEQKKKSLASINRDQAGEYRHKDASEAYDRGYQAGLKNIRDHSSDQDLKDLGYSQKDNLNQRHKSCVSAYHIGFVDGQKEYKRKK